MRRSRRRGDRRRSTRPLPSTPTPPSCARSLWNLVRNAADAGAKTVRVSRRARRARRIAIADDGWGMAEGCARADVRSVLHDQAEGHRASASRSATRSSPSTAAASTRNPGSAKARRWWSRCPRRSSLASVQCPICTQALEGGELVMVCTACHQTLGGGLVGRRDRRVHGARRRRSSTAHAAADDHPRADRRVRVVRQARARGEEAARPPGDRAVQRVRVARVRHLRGRARRRLALARDAPAARWR